MNILQNIYKTNKQIVMKNLILVRGASGSGKSTFVETLLNIQNIVDKYEPNKESIIVDEVSADKFFIDDNNNYNFNPKLLPEAHKECQDFVNHCMHLITKQHKHDKHTIFVHNTFTKEWEMEPYYELAKKYGYRVTTIIMENRHESDSIHGVPSDVISAQKDRFEIKL
tara:strand:- start:5418 stop:5921 length:504 start_codon:yes stop_codon:yes gene_type:complete